MRYFVGSTRYNIDKKYWLKSGIIEKVEDMITVCKKDWNSYIALDFETTGLCPILDDDLLLAIGTPEDQIVFDSKQYNIKPILELLYYNNMKLIGHNIKFDWSIIDAKYNIRFKEVFDTMIASQKTYQNYFDVGEYAHRYDNVVHRAFGFYPESVKAVRKGFINRDPKIDPYTDDEFLYVCEDVEYLHKLAKFFHEQFVRDDRVWWMYKVEFALIPILGASENYGLDIDVDGLLKIIKKTKEEVHELGIRLDKLVQEIGDELLEGDDKYMIKGGKFTRPRNDYEHGRQLDIFGNAVPEGYKLTAKKKRIEKAKKNIANINWNSADQIVDVFARLKQPLPTDSGYLIIPIFDDDKVLKNHGVEYETGKPINHSGYLTSYKAFADYFVKVPESPVRELIETLKENGQKSHRINVYGEGFISKINPITGRIHTIYRQASTANGRFSSGGGRGLPTRIQSQNFPRDNSIRNLIKGGVGYNVITCDLSGAEVTIMCDKSNDRKLYEWAVKNDDAHSPIVMNSWKHIFLYRAGFTAGKWKDYFEFTKNFRFGRLNKVADELSNHNKESVRYWANLAKTFVVSKKTNKPVRQAGKNATFGSVYGMKAGKAHETYSNTVTEVLIANPNDDKATMYQIDMEEAKVALWAIKKAIPVTFRFIEGVVAEAFTNGYLVLNDRSKSKVWFKPVIELRKAIYQTIKELKEEQNIDAELVQIDTKKGKYLLSSGDEFELDWQQMKDIDGQARNLTISGTQADMVKECIVVIQEEIDRQYLDASFMMQVHDEVVYRYNTSIKEVEFVDDFGKVYMVSFKDFIAKTMEKVCTRYLKHFKMHADAEDKEYWTK